MTYGDDSLLEALQGDPLLSQMSAVRNEAVVNLPGDTPGITVADLVGRGRHPQRGIFSRWSATDDHAVASALDLTGTADLARRPVAEGRLHAAGPPGRC